MNTSIKDLKTGDMCIVKISGFDNAHIIRRLNKYELMLLNYKDYLIIAIRIALVIMSVLIPPLLLLLLLYVSIIKKENK